MKEKVMEKTFLLIVESCDDTQTDCFEQIIEALNDRGINGSVCEVEEGYNA
jgi:hypothetical protein|tara:strand:- start:1538 stop:1690 length:153 start_codon:yes stop_codon:yes gene_type:complete